MKSCQHDWLSSECQLTLDLVIDDWQGLTDAIIHCSRCHQYALIRLVHWQGLNLSTRVFSVSALRSEVASVFLRDMNTGYCDLSRHQNEVNAMISVADPISAVVVASLPSLTLLMTYPPSVLGDRAVKSWREETPVEVDPYWLSLVGDVKA